MITAIKSSADLADVLNTEPLTAADAAETPRDWIAGIWVCGTIYPLDPDATTETLAVLADGTAAVRLTGDDEFCGVAGHAGHRAHWCPADTDSASWGDARGVERDWRNVYVWDANGFSESAVHPTLDEARSAFHREVAILAQEEN